MDVSAANPLGKSEWEYLDVGAVPQELRWRLRTGRWPWSSSSLVHERERGRDSEKTVFSHAASCL